MKNYKEISEKNYMEVTKMGMTCPMNGCHSTGWCKHKTMIAMMMIIVVGAILYFVLK